MTNRYFLRSHSDRIASVSEQTFETPSALTSAFPTNIQSPTFVNDFDTISQTFDQSHPCLDDLDSTHNSIETDIGDRTLEDRSAMDNLLSSFINPLTNLPFDNVEQLQQHVLTLQQNNSNLQRTTNELQTRLAFQSAPANPHTVATQNIIHHREFRLKLPEENINNIRKRIELWEQSTKDLSNDRKKQLLLEALTEWSYGGYVLDGLPDLNSANYESIKTQLLYVLGQDDIQLLISPQQTDPKRAYLAAKAISGGSIDKRHLLKLMGNHLSSDDSQKLMMADDIENALSVIVEHNRQSLFNKIKANNHTGFQTQAVNLPNTQSTASTTQNPDIANSLNRLLNKMDSLESKIAALESGTLAQKTTPNPTATCSNIAQSDVFHFGNQSSVNQHTNVSSDQASFASVVACQVRSQIPKQCFYHRSKGPYAYSCQGPDLCDEYNKDTFPVFDSRTNVHFRSKSNNYKSNRFNNGSNNDNRRNNNRNNQYNYDRRDNNRNYNQNDNNFYNNNQNNGNHRNGNDNRGNDCGNCNSNNFHANQIIADFLSSTQRLNQQTNQQPNSNSNSNLNSNANTNGLSNNQNFH